MNNTREPYPYRVANILEDAETFSGINRIHFAQVHREFYNELQKAQLIPKKNDEEEVRRNPDVSKFTLLKSLKDEFDPEKGVLECLVLASEICREIRSGKHEDAKELFEDLKDVIILVEYYCIRRNTDDPDLLNHLSDYLTHIHSDARNLVYPVEP